MQTAAKGPAQRLREIADEADKQRVASSKMLAALVGTRTVLEHYASRLESVHALMAREMEMDIKRLSTSITLAMSAGIKLEDEAAAAEAEG